MNAGKVVLHGELLTKVWGPEYRDDMQYLRVWISRVRRKLGAAPGEPGPITTFQGIGYVLNVDEPPALELDDAPAIAGGGPGGGLTRWRSAGRRESWCRPRRSSPMGPMPRRRSPTRPSPSNGWVGSASPSSS